MDTPLHGLIPYGPSREPGLILASAGGTIHFWDSLGMGLAGGERAFKVSLGLAQDERVTTLTRADVSGLVLLMVLSSRVFSPVLATDVHSLHLRRPSLPSGFVSSWWQTCTHSTSFYQSTVFAFPLPTLPLTQLLVPVFGGHTS